MTGKKHQFAKNLQENLTNSWEMRKSTITQALKAPTQFRNDYQSPDFIHLQKKLRSIGNEKQSLNCILFLKCAIKC
ncbi:CLUMA_CG006435, isoform A [Clunio marinus]|uniref:CLUMA_CG006435, isoform A n=1 Tax=Clunio marinus TaxID=568069 RepID=A0A1J1HZP6_9DIPT|nr:CLUMA_CG006435, isoform A [Clunio marinus]